MISFLTDFVVFSKLLGFVVAFTFLLVSLELLALDLEVFVLVKMLYIFSVRKINCPSLKSEFEL